MAEILAQCQLNAIARYEFSKIAFCYSIDGMKTIGEIRRGNLLALLDIHGTLAALNELLQLARTDATLSQIKNRNITSRGKPKMMGHLLARRIETALDLGTGWMDSEHAANNYREQRIAHAVKVMEHMEEWQLDQAIQIVDTIAQPPKKEGNSGAD